MVSLLTEIREGLTLYRLRWFEADRRRRGIRLGSISRPDAENIQFFVRRILGSKRAGKPPDLAARQWLESLDIGFREKLIQQGLIDPEQTATAGPTLEEFVAGYIDGRKIGKHRRRNLNNSKGKLVTFFGKERPIKSIKPADADDWRQWLVDQRFKKATISKHVRDAVQFFRRALRMHLIRINPMEDLEQGPQTGNPAYVTEATIDKVIAAATSAEWKLLIALSRYGGLRTPSETNILKWDCINWAEGSAGRIIVHSPKTERHDKELRIIPLFDEIRPHLERVYDEQLQREALGAKSSPWVLSMFDGNKDKNPHTQFKRLVKRAGIKPWNDLLRSLRSSRQTDLLKRHPIHVVCEWIGNTEAVARKHYLQVTDDDFERAFEPKWDQSGTPSGETPPKRAATGNSVQQEPGESCTQSHASDSSYPRQESNL